MSSERTVELAEERDRGARARLSFVLTALVVCLGMRVSHLSLARLPDYAHGLVFELCVLALTWLSFQLLALLSPARFGPTVLLYPLVLFELGLVFAHTWFFDVAIERQLTVLDMTLSGLAQFFTTALPARGLWSLLGWLVALLSMSGLLMRTRFRLSARRWLRLHASVGAALVVGLPWSLAAARVPSPWFDVLHEQWKLATAPRLHASVAPADPALLAGLDQSASALGGGPTRYPKVIVLVMETMTAAAFERESLFLPQTTFVHQERARTHQFERYFPNNQDSRTGMLDMLFSRLIPYEAYSDEGVARYRLLARAPSLVDRLRALSYASAFAVSQTTLEEVVDELSWDQNLMLSTGEVASARADKKLCFTPDEWEESCEDLVLLPKVLDFVSTHERAFVYQEFIWGHAAIYNDVSGKSNAAYYSAYVDALRAGLKERGLLDQTLIVLTSDHGFRDKSRQNELASYQLPLLFHASDLTAESDTRLLSHTDFATLLFEQLAPAGSEAPRAPDHELVLIVGPTGQGHLFAVGRRGGELLAWHRAGKDLLLSHSGALPLSPDALLGLFAQYRASFDRRLRSLPAR